MMVNHALNSWIPPSTGVSFCLQKGTVPTYIVEPPLLTYLRTWNLEPFTPFSLEKRVVIKLRMTYLHTCLGSMIISFRIVAIKDLVRWFQQQHLPSPVVSSEYIFTVMFFLRSSYLCRWRVQSTLLIRGMRSAVLRVAYTVWISAFRRAKASK